MIPKTRPQWFQWFWELRPVVERWQRTGQWESWMKSATASQARQLKTIRSETDPPTHTWKTQAANTDSWNRYWPVNRLTDNSQPWQWLSADHHSPLHRAQNLEELFEGEVTLYLNLKQLLSTANRLFPVEIKTKMAINEQTSPGYYNRLLAS